MTLEEYSKHLEIVRAPFVNDAKYLVENFSPSWKKDPNSFSYDYWVRIIAWLLYRFTNSTSEHMEEERIYEIAEYLEITPEELLNGPPLPF